MKDERPAAGARMAAASGARAEEECDGGVLPRARTQSVAALYPPVSVPSICISIFCHFKIILASIICPPFKNKNTRC